MSIRTASLITSAAVFFVALFVFVTASFAQTTTTSTTTTTTTSTPTGTQLGITLNATPRLAVGTQDALLALVTLQAGSASAIHVTSLPVSMTFSGTATASQLSDCRVRNVTNLATPLNNSFSPVSGTNTFSLTSPLTVPAGTTITLAVTCDLSASAAVGSTISVSLTPGMIAATVSGSSTTVTPIIGQGINGGTGPTSGTVTLAPANTTPTVPTVPTVPGVPNTGTGGMTNGILIVLSALLAFGSLYLVRRMQYRAPVRR